MRNSNKTIGIIGGAGPMAGALFMRYVIDVCQRQFGCKEDEDFPKIILLSIPFSQMLKPDTQEQNEDAVSEQLKGALDFLTKHNASCIGIACNTLHGFIQNTEAYPALIHLIDLTGQYLAQNNVSQALVLGTQTSVMNGVHAFEQTKWPSACLQKEVDGIIDSVLEGDTSSTVKTKFTDVAQRCLQESPHVNALILGCTELSELMDGDKTLSALGKPCIDPLVILAEKLCECALGGRKNTC